MLCICRYAICHDTRFAAPPDALLQARYVTRRFYARAGLCMMVTARHAVAFVMNAAAAARYVTRDIVHAMPRAQR